jgi:hypothetical protein
VQAGPSPDKRSPQAGAGEFFGILNLDSPGRPGRENGVPNGSELPGPQFLAGWNSELRHQATASSSKLANTVGSAAIQILAFEVQADRLIASEDPHLEIRFAGRT